MRVIFRSRRSIWWSWRMTPDAPRIVLDVSYVTLINHENLFSWQAQYLVKLEDDSCCSAHCIGRFICDADQSWDSFFVAGAVFGEVGGWLLMLRAFYWTFHLWRCNDEIHFSWQAQYLVKLENGSCRFAHCTGHFICDADQSWDSFFVAGAVFGEVGGWLLLLRALYWTFHMWCWSMMRVIFRGRGSIWWCWRVTPVAPRILLDVSYVTLINGEIHFSWRAQYLVKLEDDSCCFAHCTGHFICDADQSWDFFFVAGAVFGEVGGWLLLLCALYRTFHVSFVILTL